MKVTKLEVAVCNVDRDYRQSFEDLRMPDPVETRSGINRFHSPS